MKVLAIVFLVLAAILAFLVGFHVWPREWYQKTDVLFLFFGLITSAWICDRLAAYIP